MNIMLATVTERTREIGIRRALGAKQGDIIQQFLTETVVLSATGGLLGVGFGFLCGPSVIVVRWLAKHLNPDLFNSLPPNIQQLQPILDYYSVVVAFLISVAVGVGFGLYPAFKSTGKMDPIEARRARCFSQTHDQTFLVALGSSSRSLKGLRPGRRRGRKSTARRARSTFPREISSRSWAPRASGQEHPCLQYARLPLDRPTPGR